MPTIVTVGADEDDEYFDEEEKAKILQEEKAFSTSMNSSTFNENLQASELIGSKVDEIEEGMDAEQFMPEVRDIELKNIVEEHVLDRVDNNFSPMMTDTYDIDSRASSSMSSDSNGSPQLQEQDPEALAKTIEDETFRRYLKIPPEERERLKNREAELPIKFDDFIAIHGFSAENQKVKNDKRNDHISDSIAYIDSQHFSYHYEKYSGSSEEKASIPSKNDMEKSSNVKKNKKRRKKQTEEVVDMDHANKTLSQEQIAEQRKVNKQLREERKKRQSNREKKVSNLEKQSKKSQEMYEKAERRSKIFSEWMDQQGIITEDVANLIPRLSEKDFYEEEEASSTKSFFITDMNDSQNYIEKRKQKEKQKSLLSMPQTFDTSNYDRKSKLSDLGSVLDHKYGSNNKDGSTSSRMPSISRGSNKSVGFLTFWNKSSVPKRPAVREITTLTNLSKLLKGYEFDTNIESGGFYVMAAHSSTSNQCSVRKMYERFFQPIPFVKSKNLHRMCKKFNTSSIGSNSSGQNMEGATASNNNNNNTTPTSRERYIVMFKEYMKAFKHDEYISTLLGGTHRGYKIIERDNAATRMFDTDFALVEFENITLKSELESRTQFVRYVVRQHEYHNMMNNERKLLNHDIETLPDDEQDHSILNSIGKLFTQWSTEDKYSDHHHHRRKLCNHPSHSYVDVSEKLNAHKLWEQGIYGQNIRVAVFDTGLSSTKHEESFSHIEDMINYTTEDSVNDELGHGTFISGVIGSKHLTPYTPKSNTTQPFNEKKERGSGCRGLAPEASVFIFKVFTSKQVSYTSWFLDAFNYAMKSGIQILNLSIGGPDYLDIPFIDKVKELTANGIIIISAIGNDGPLYGTLNNPADLVNVIGVGGIDDNDNIAKFSSRGVTTYELRFNNGYGRVKPDIVTMSVKLRGLGLNKAGDNVGYCHSILSGTSVASPVIAGAITLLASSTLKNKDTSTQNSDDISIRAKMDDYPNTHNSLLPLINPASIKQILLESAQRVHHANIFEQGAGKLNLEKAYELLQDYMEKAKPRATFYPSELDLTSCPYMWPYCSQPIYHTAMPIVFNVTVLNAMSASGRVVGEPVFVPGKYGDFLDVTFTHPRVMWPYSGWLGVQISVNSGGRFFNGYCEGTIKMKIMSPPLGVGKDGNEMQVSEMELKLKVKVIQPPLRQQRILWDQYHNIQYPPGYIPRDNLGNKDEILDWNGDHIHTNFRDLYIFLRNKGYYVEILTGDLTTFDASKYSTLMIVDSEEEFTEKEREKLKEDVQVYGLSVAVFADWYSVPIMKHIKFFDDNTYTVWTPITGGCNLPALNALLDPFNIVFGTRVYTGEITIGKEKASFLSGTSIIKFPEEGMLASFHLKDQGIEILSGKQNSKPILGTDSSSTIHKVPVLGFSKSGKGRIAVFGDSNCLDAVGNPTHNCFWLLDQILQYTSQHKMSEEFIKDANIKTLSHLFISQSSSVVGASGLVAVSTNNSFLTVSDFFFLPLLACVVVVEGEAV
ncbi:subtilisin-like serine peptidase [Naegleria gruberi]|uniref:Subtilisin-like serine peptidase n=1 Tax=Naegleria gruberi TaxID=5762 RepID=D2V753_NAEGR|nr:subtilisin-like serine peptidase [Naegleria gruberi]EFC47310.1 subtilisin-like serine peptidase [Naegleria gruberi]|eukprot:XP_002680054.1 subtilisin-like serine peptidase [Naegleria gruberi strain NEG-M]